MHHACICVVCVRCSVVVSGWSCSVWMSCMRCFHKNICDWLTIIVFFHTLWADLSFSPCCVWRVADWRWCIQKKKKKKKKRFSTSSSISHNCNLLVCNSILLTEYIYNFVVVAITVLCCISQIFSIQWIIHDERYIYGFVDHASFNLHTHTHTHIALSLRCMNEWCHSVTVNSIAVDRA